LSIVACLEAKITTPIQKTNCRRKNIGAQVIAMGDFQIIRATFCEIRLYYIIIITSYALDYCMYYCLFFTVVIVTISVDVLKMLVALNLSSPRRELSHLRYPS